MIWLASYCQRWPANPSGSEASGLDCPSPGQSSAAVASAAQKNVRPLKSAAPPFPQGTRYGRWTSGIFRRRR